MLTSEFKTRLTGIIKDTVFDEPMKNHTTFKIGGPADAYCEAKSEIELVSVLKLCREFDVDYMIFGNGSNMLVGDGGIRGVVIKPLLNDIRIEGLHAYVGAGVLLSRFSTELMKAGLSGLEFAGGIPGSIGGGVFMNAGAYGGALADRIVSVTYIDENLTLTKKSKEELKFGYRHTFFTNKKCIITECEFLLEEGDSDEIKEKIAEYNKMRSDKQPLEFPSAGSVFKRPEGYFAGKLIEDSNLKGVRIGGAEVSKKHAGFIINADNASAKDVTELIAHIKKTVFDNFGVMLEEEVKLIGEEA